MNQHPKNAPDGAVFTDCPCEHCRTSKERTRAQRAQWAESRPPQRRRRPASHRVLPNQAPTYLDNAGAALADAAPVLGTDEHGRVRRSSILPALSHVPSWIVEASHDDERIADALRIALRFGGMIQAAVKSRPALDYADVFQALVMEHLKREGYRTSERATHRRCGASVTDGDLVRLALQQFADQERHRATALPDDGGTASDAATALVDATGTEPIDADPVAPGLDRMRPYHADAYGVHTAGAPPLTATFGSLPASERDAVRREARSLIGARPDASRVRIGDALMALGGSVRVGLDGALRERRWVRYASDGAASPASRLHRIVRDARARVDKRSADAVAYHGRTVTQRREHVREVRGAVGVPVTHWRPLDGLQATTLPERGRRPSDTVCYLPDA